MAIAAWVILARRLERGTGKLSFRDEKYQGEHNVCLLYLYFEQKRLYQTYTFIIAFFYYKTVPRQSYEFLLLLDII